MKKRDLYINFHGEESINPKSNIEDKITWLTNKTDFGFHSFRVPTK